MKQVQIQSDFESWRDAARNLLHANLLPDEVMFVARGLDDAILPNLLESTELPTAAGVLRVPREFLQVAEAVACHVDPERWQLLYRVLWRITHGERELLKISVDDDVSRLASMEKQVRFDSHKMKAFVRFRRIIDHDGGERFVAWHRSEHRVLKRTGPFFVRRFAAMKWSILTQFDSAHWDGESLTFGPGVARERAPQPDELESLWRTYYGSTFNPARVNVRMMQKEMPHRYWATMPETQMIPDLLAAAPARVRAMVDRTDGAFAGASAYLPKTISLPTLREAVRTCRGCDLCQHATQPVFGDGPADAMIAFVGEQPGDQEDLQGRPFVGPAGQVFDRALGTVGIDRSQVYVTNAVKHFKFEQRGTRRIHSKPNAREMSACLPWLEEELKLIRPAILVLLGSTAAQSLVGRQFRITRERGRPFESKWSPWTIATFHPSALLRIPDEAARAAAEEQFMSDLQQASRQLEVIRASQAA